MSEHSEGVSRRVVVEIDGSLGSHAAIRWAIDNAKSGDRIMLRHVWTVSPLSLVIDRTDSTEHSAAGAFAHIAHDGHDRRTVVRRIEPDSARTRRQACCRPRARAS